MEHSGLISNGIKVVVAEEDPVLRNGIRGILEADDEISVCGLVAEGREVCDLCERERPDVILMDLKSGGGEAICQIKEVSPEVKVLVFTSCDDEETILTAFSSGADGYILKGIDGERVIMAIKSIYCGCRSANPEVFDTIMENAEETRRRKAESQRMELTDREVQLASLIACGFNNLEIADEICVAEGTVKNNISKLLKKLELKNRTQIAAYVARNGLDISSSDESHS